MLYFIVLCCAVLCCHFVSPNDKLTRNRPQKVLIPNTRAKFGIFLCQMVDEADAADDERFPTLDELKMYDVCGPMQTMWIDKKRVAAANSEN